MAGSRQVVSMGVRSEGIVASTGGDSRSFNHSNTAGSSRQNSANGGQVGN